jgi:hypothetical protein
MAVFLFVSPCNHQGDIALMMEAARTSETLVNFYQTTRRYNPEDSHLRDGSCCFVDTMLRISGSVVVLSVNQFPHSYDSCILILYKTSGKSPAHINTERTAVLLMPVQVLFLSHATKSLISCELNLKSTKCHIKVQQSYLIHLSFLNIY